MSNCQHVYKRQEADSRKSHTDFFLIMGQSHRRSPSPKLSIACVRVTQINIEIQILIFDVFRFVITIYVHCSSNSQYPLERSRLRVTYNSFIIYLNRFIYIWIGTHTTMVYSSIPIYHIFPCYRYLCSTEYTYSLKNTQHILTGCCPIQI